MNSQLNSEEEMKFNQMEKIFATNDGEKILYCTASENGLYILTDQKKFLIYEKNSTINNYIRLNVVQNILKKDSKFQTKEITSKIWTNNSGDHVLIKTDKSLFYYNPYFKTQINLREIKLEFKNKYYVEPYSIAFNEQLKSKDEFEILVTDYFSEIYNIKIKIFRKSEIKINFFEKIFSFKTKFELGQEQILQKKNENENEKKDLEFECDFELDIDFDIMDLINFDKDERIIDMKIINNEKNEEKIIIANTKNKILIFSGKEKTFQELFLKYLANNDLMLKSYRNLPNKLSNNPRYNQTHLQILSSYTKNSIKETIFGCKGAFGYCLGNIFSNNNNNDAMIVINSRKPKYVGEKKIPLFVFDDEELKNDTGIISACQSKLHIFFLYDNCLLMMNKITLRYVNVYLLSSKFNDVFYIEFNNNIFLYNENEITKISCHNEDKYVYSNYIDINKFDLALKVIPNENKELKAKIHKLNAEFFFEQKKYELAGKEYSYSDEKFEHVCYKFLRDGKTEGLIAYLKMIKDNKLDDKNDKIINNDLFINKYLIFTWLSTLLINQGKKGNFWEEFNSYQKDKYLNKQSIYRYLKINRKEKELNDYAALKNDHKIIIQNLIFKGKYDEAFNYIENTLGNGKANNEECLKYFMKYFDLFVKRSVKNTIKILDNINFSVNDLKHLVNALMEIDFKKDMNEEEEKNYNLIISYLKRIIHEHITSNNQNNNLNNFYLFLLSLSKKEENKKEIINYLKSPLNTYTIKDNKMSIIYSNKKIFIDLNFAEKIFKEMPQALALIYFYMKKYEKCINILLIKEEDELAIQIAQNIPNEEKKKKIWMKLFKEYKQNKKYNLKDILELSDGALKIEDILQYLDSEVKLKDIKNDLQSCIDVYEQGVSSIKQKIITYNKSNNSIQEDIFKTKKRKFELIHSDIKCHKCGNPITENKFFLYPCGHVFDVDCLIKILVDFEEKSSGGIKGRVQAVKNLSQKIMNMQKKKSEGKKNDFMDELSKIRKKTKGAMKRFITLVKKDDTKSIWDEKDDEEESELTREEEIQLKELSNGLNDILKQECPLCGQEMINSTQMMFSNNGDEKWANLVE